MDMDQYLRQIDHGIIVDVGMTEPDDFGDEYPIIVVRKGADLYTVCIQRDPEGNGAGHPDIQRIKKGAIDYD